MTLDPPAANAFIRGYKRLLLEIAELRRLKGTREVLAVLASARRQLCDKPALLGEAVARLKANSELPDNDVIRAVQTLELGHWIYLRDTKNYSIFVHPSGNSALGVVGLTDRIRDIVGASSVIIETGVVRFSGRFVCDGLVSQIVHLGPNYRKGFGRMYSALKSEGHFHVHCEA